MIINVGYALVGPELELVREVNIEVADGVITHIGHGYASNSDVTLDRGIAIPALVNAHLHILDYAFPEYDECEELGGGGERATWAKAQVARYTVGGCGLPRV
jgi:Cytosine deaminase and related metal-dependent hydrolases